jgi:cysteinyl-tRNA synthetase
MAEQLLGVGFEIHGGGNDLAFPHHENEAAQTRMGRGAELAQIWMHNGMLQLGGGTMGKSLGNAIRLHEVIADVGRDALLMLFAGAHYRQPMAFDDERLAEAGARVARIRDAARGLADGESPADMRRHRDAFFTALADDFNTAQALGALFEWIREANRRSEPVGRDDLVEMLSVLGLENLVEAGARAGAEELAMLDLREAARAAKDWAEADRLRDELGERGWTVRDGPDGPELVARER